MDIVSLTAAWLVPVHGQTLADRTKPGPRPMIPPVWHAPAMQYLPVRPNLELKTQPKQIFGSLAFYIAPLSQWQTLYLITVDD